MRREILRESEYRCLACGGETDRWFGKRVDARSYPIRRCSYCKSAFVLPRPNKTEIEELYRSPAFQEANKAAPSLAENKITFRDPWRIAERSWNLAKGKDFLDIGAGDGIYSLAARRQGFSVRAVEPDRSARERFRLETGFDAEDGWLSPQWAAQHAETFDVVLLSQVLEHLLCPQEAAAAIASLLRPAGLAVIAVPQFRSWLSRLMGKRDIFISPPYHLNYFTRSGLDSLFQKAGFSAEFGESVTWYEPHRVVKRLGGGVFGRVVGLPAVLGLNMFFWTADPLGGGNTLEMYFRKVR